MTINLFFLQPQGPQPVRADFNTVTEWLEACKAWDDTDDMGGQATTGQKKMEAERRRDADEMMGTWTHDIKFNGYGVDVIDYKIYLSIIVYYDHRRCFILICIFDNAARRQIQDREQRWPYCWLGVMEGLENAWRWLSARNSLPTQRCEGLKIGAPVASSSCHKARCRIRRGKRRRSTGGTRRHTTFWSKENGLSPAPLWTRPGKVMAGIVSTSAAQRTPSTS